MTFRNEVQHKQMCSLAWAVRSLVSCMMGESLVICMPQFTLKENGEIYFLKSLSLVMDY